MNNTMDIKNIKYLDFRKKIHKKWLDNYLHEYLLRPISNYIVYFIIKYCYFITWDMVTIFSLFVSFFWWLFLVFWVNNDFLILCWWLCFFLFHLLDLIDWDVARAKVLFRWWKFTNHWSLFDALMHHYYNLFFIISLWYLLYMKFNFIMLLYVWIIWTLLLIINEIILNYIRIINIQLNIKEDKNIINFKSMEFSDWNKIKDIFSAFASMLWVSILFIWCLILDILFWTDYNKFMLYIILIIFIIGTHVNLFFKMIRL